jgi:hypothetical protein
LSLRLSLTGFTIALWSSQKALLSLSTSKTAIAKLSLRSLSGGRERWFVKRGLFTTPLSMLRESFRSLLPLSLSPSDGQWQELVERELSQTEVLHMECRETGEFAHRESTDYEHYETFNNEVRLLSHCSALL